MQRLIDAETLKELFPDNGEGSWTYNATAKAYIDAQPTIELEPCGDTISRKAAIEDVGDDVYTGSKIRRWLKSLPSIQPSDSKIENAIRVLRSKYNKALSQDYIRNPIAWALYQTWKECDR